MNTKMTMAQIRELEGEPLIMFYNDSISTLRQYNQEISKKNIFERELSKIQTKLSAFTIKAFSCLFTIVVFFLSIGILASQHVIWYALLAFSLLLPTVALIVSLKSKKLRQWVEKKRDEYRETEAEIKEKLKSTEENIQDIMQQDSYANLLLAFSCHLQLDYIEKLKAIVGSFQALNHEDAVKYYEKQKQIEFDQKMKLRAVEAQESIARSQKSLAVSTSKLTDRIEDLQNEVEKLRRSCAKGHLSQEDTDSALGVAADCTSIISNVIGILTTLSGL